MGDYEAITQCLRKIQKGYEKRDTEAIDQYLEDLFSTEVKATVIGTSDNELKFDQEGIKDLFLMDWKYWGDLRLDIDKGLIRVHGDTAWVHLPGTVKYTFSSDDETYANFVRFVGDYYDEKSTESQKSSHLKLAEINWLIAHLLHQREPLLNRDYYWQMRMFIIMRRLDKKWVINHITFSFPNESFFADERINEQTEYGEAYRREIETYQAHTNYGILSASEKSYLSSFYLKFLRNQTVSLKEAEEYINEDSCMLTTCKGVYTGRSEIVAKLWDISRLFDEISLNLDIGIYETNQECLWFHTNGLFSKRIEKRDFFHRVEDNVKRVLSSQRADKEKLFLIRRDISTAFKEYAHGEDYIYPFRFVAFLIKKGNSFYFDYMQFSYPMNNILEQINNDF